MDCIRNNLPAILKGGNYGFFVSTRRSRLSLSSATSWVTRGKIALGYGFGPYGYLHTALFSALLNVSAKTKVHCKSLASSCYIFVFEEKK